MPTLRVTLLQTDLAWQAPDTNFSTLEPEIRALRGKTDLIVLPEMFSTGFIDAPSSIPKAHQLERVLPWLKSMAKASQSAIYTSSPFFTGANRWANRAWFITPQGEFHHYDKAHLFCLGREADDYSAGKHRTIVGYRGWQIRLIICYDLRFPSFCRNTQDYDLLLCIANWPQARRHAWKALLTARALENQAYVVGVNRIGSDGKGLSYAGDSRLVDFTGKVLLDANNRQKNANSHRNVTTVIDQGSLKQFRRSYPFLDDRDRCILPQLTDEVVKLN